MRIVAGEARGRRLAALPGMDTRPTLERVKEGMFSAVQFGLPGARVLDLFAGSGQLGLEAVSRGAAACTFVDEDAAAARLIGENARAAGLAAKCRVVRADAWAFLVRGGELYDLALADPPYGFGRHERLLGLLAAVLAPGALALCEAAAETPLPQAAGGLVLEKLYRYGTVQVARYRLPPDADPKME